MIKSKNYISGSEWWINSENLSFPEILTQSRLPDKWSRYNSKNILKMNSILKPVNEYVFNLYQKPEIVKTNNNFVTFRQRTHAEIWVEEKEDNTLYALDKCHQRQFYPSSNSFIYEGSFLPTYRFYVPWFINKNANIEIDPVKNEKTPFYVNKKTIIGNPIDDHKNYVNTEFVDFKIKNTGEYLLKEKYAIIGKNTAMYDMSVYLTDEEILNLEDYYE